METKKEIQPLYTYNWYDDMMIVNINSWSNELAEEHFFSLIARVSIRDCFALVPDWLGPFTTKYGQCVQLFECSVVNIIFHESTLTISVLHCFEETTL